MKLVARVARTRNLSVAIWHTCTFSSSVALVNFRSDAGLHWDPFKGLAISEGKRTILAREHVIDNIFRKLPSKGPAIIKCNYLWWHGAREQTLTIIFSMRRTMFSCVLRELFSYFGQKVSFGIKVQSEPGRMSCFNVGRFMGRLNWSFECENYSSCMAGFRPTLLSGRLLRGTGKKRIALPTLWEDNPLFYGQLVLAGKFLSWFKGK